MILRGRAGKGKGGTLSFLLGLTHYLEAFQREEIYQQLWILYVEEFWFQNIKCYSNTI